MWSWVTSWRIYAVGERIGEGGYAQGEEGEDVGPDAGGLDGGVDAERFKGGEDDEDGRPAVVEREREVNEHFVRGVLRLVVLLDDVIDVLCTQHQLTRAGTGEPFEWMQGSAEGRTVTAELTKRAKMKAAERSN